MSYAEMLNSIIAESELSLRQISNRCNTLNLAITPSYISQLKNGKLPPPSEEVSMTLAKACGSTKQAYLVFQGYMEKAPKLMKEYMLAASSLNKAMMESLCKTAGTDFTSDMQDYVKGLDILAALELSSQFVSLDDPVKASNLVKEITLSAGGVTAADTQGEIINLFLGDGAMSPLIPTHAFVYIMPTKLDLLKDRDIIAFYTDNRKIPTLRWILFIKDKVFLLPEDKSYQAYCFDELSELNYIGKVVSYKVDL
jgi:hypothetical protein